MSEWQVKAGKSEFPRRANARLARKLRVEANCCAGRTSAKPSSPGKSRVGWPNAEARQSRTQPKVSHQLPPTLRCDCVAHVTAPPTPVASVGTGLATTTRAGRSLSRRKWAKVIAQHGNLAQIGRRGQLPARRRLDWARNGACITWPRLDGRRSHAHARPAAGTGRAERRKSAGDDWGRARGYVATCYVADAGGGQTKVVVAPSVDVASGRWECRCCVAWLAGWPLGCSPGARLAGARRAEQSGQLVAACDRFACDESGVFAASHLHANASASTRIPPLAHKHRRAEPEARAQGRENNANKSLLAAAAASCSAQTRVLVRIGLHWPAVANAERAARRAQTSTGSRRRSIATRREEKRSEDRGARRHKHRQTQSADAARNAASAQNSARRKLHNAIVASASTVASREWSHRLGPSAHSTPAAIGITSSTTTTTVSLEPSTITTTTTAAATAAAANRRTTHKLHLASSHSHSALGWRTSPPEPPGYLRPQQATSAATAATTATRKTHFHVQQQPPSDPRAKRDATRPPRAPTTCCSTSFSSRAAARTWSFL